MFFNLNIFEIGSHVAHSGLQLTVEPAGLEPLTLVLRLFRVIIITYINIDAPLPPSVMVTLWTLRGMYAS